MSSNKYIRAEEGEEKNSVVYYDEDGNSLSAIGKDILMNPMIKLAQDPGETIIREILK